MLLLFGADGFLGRHVSARAHQSGTPCTIISRSGDRTFADENAPSCGVMSLAEFETAPGADAIRRSCALVYLASATVPSTDVEYAGVAELRLNVEPFWRVASRALDLNCALKLVYISSGGAVYGDLNGSNATEQSPTEPISPYGLGKLLCEHVLSFLQRHHGGTIQILRPSNPVGRWQKRRDQGLVSVAVQRLLREEPLTIYGDGSTVRDYIAASDVADAILRAATATAPTGIWNVGSGTGLTVSDLLALIANRMGKPLNLEFRSARKTDVRHIVLDSTAFRQAFNWKPTRSIEDAVEEVILEHTGPKGAA